MKSKPKLDICSICQERADGLARQIYIIKGELGRYVFDVTKAKQIVRDGRKPCAIPIEALVRFLDVNNQWDEKHFAHIDPLVPGIVGQRFGGMALFDGTHRAALARQEGRTFYAHVLTYEESAACLISQDVAEMSAEVMAREIHGVLRNNAQVAERIFVELTADADDNLPEFEASVRQHLTPDENQKVELVFHRRKAA